MHAQFKWVAAAPSIRVPSLVKLARVEMSAF